MHIVKHERSKFDEEARECVFVRYCTDTKDYRLIDLNNPKKILKARDVTFIEDQMARHSTQNHDTYNVILEKPNSDDEVLNQNINEEEDNMTMDMDESDVTTNN